MRSKFSAIKYCATKSGSKCQNNFEARTSHYAGAMNFGIMAGLCQAFMIRASWIHTSRRLPSRPIP